MPSLTVATYFGPAKSWPANSCKTPRRLRFTLLAASLVAWSPATGAQSPPPRIGLIAWGACEVAAYAAGEGEFGVIVTALERLGYRVGETIALDCRSSGARDTGFLDAAKDLVRATPDVIVTFSQPAGQAAHQATSAIPIVTIVSGDPVAAGLAKTLARPGGNLTGVSYYATELTAKRLELLREMIPGLSKLGVLANPDVGYLPFEVDTRRAAADFGIEAIFHQVTEPEGIEAAFAEMKAEGVDAVFVLPDVMFSVEAQRIADMGLEHRLPIMAWGTWFAHAGCLMAYSADYAVMIDRLAFQVDLILKGAKAGDVPIEQPTTLHLLINLKTAEALGITPPESILISANELTE